MAIGLYILGTSGATQVDELYKNFAVVASGSVTTVAGGKFASYKQVTLTGGTSPLIAVAGTDHHCVTRLDISGSDFTWTIESDAAAGASFSYWIFDVPAASGAAMGMRVYNASGDLVFDAGLKYLRVEDFKTISSTPGSSSYTSGRTYATITAIPGLVLDSYFDPGAGFDVTDISGLLHKFSSNTLSWKVVYAETFPSFIADSTDYGKLLVVDVTNY